MYSNENPLLHTKEQDRETKNINYVKILTRKIEKKHYIINSDVKLNYKFNLSLQICMHQN